MPSSRDRNRCGDSRRDTSRRTMTGVVLKIGIDELMRRQDAKKEEMSMGRGEVVKRIGD